ncbi:putative rRNA-processing protein UTP23 [Venustampulla echinocandica]|uniref:U three protein 23 n=1 Tax=Venustampulla echinocandica TaxID=2656787 RepID=A0A370TMG1_9HELO|nr:putative rRNA-processing protein UTP23 [Venustampulla echinocandica]RDL36704.1 putative rRNA-processing protein UTP23 [Venustampulla echinocandica]
MEQYGMSFGFREPYQVLVDSEIIKDADKFKMDLVGGLERTLHGQVKPMITQCSMRHLYAAASEPGVSYLIDKAKTYERRRCDHRPEDFPEPLSNKECLASVVDPKGNKTNKHCYVIASQDLELRKHMRGVMGVPLVYINRSVMIMEPMASATAQNRAREERGKFRAGLKRGSGSLKRKRDDEEGEKDGEEAGDDDAAPKKKWKAKGPKQPNPLAVKKAKKKPEDGTSAAAAGKESKKGPATEGSGLDASEPGTKRKRRRKHSKPVGETESVAAVPVAVAVDDE